METKSCHAWHPALGGKRWTFLLRLLLLSLCKLISCQNFQNGQDLLRVALKTWLQAILYNSHMLRDVTYTFWSENRVQDCAVWPVAVAAHRRKVIRPVIMATGRRSKRSKVKGHVGTAIQHSCLGRNQAAPWPWRCAPRPGFAWSGPHPHAGLLLYKPRGSTSFLTVSLDLDYGLWTRT